MDRATLYTQEQLRSFDLLILQKHALKAVAGLAVSLLGGTQTLLSGLGATATSPASLTINLAQGWIYKQASVDATTWGALPVDNTVVEQQGYAAAQPIALSTQALNAGQSQWILIQGNFAPVDEVAPGDPTGGLIYYYNSANPSQPFQGPNNSGSPQNTERAATVSIAALAGAPATTGSEVPPTPTTGWVPLYLIDLTFGQTTITSGQILVAGPSVGINVPSNYPNAPFIRGLVTGNPADSISHHLGIPGHAPKIDLATETQGHLSFSNLTFPGFTSGSVIFFNGTTFAQDNPHLFWDDTNNRLGIGTSGPQKTLHVIGDSEIDGDLTITGGGTALSIPSGSAVVGGIVESSYAGATALYAPNGGATIGGDAVIGGSADIAGNAAITGSCNAAGGAWRGSLDIVTTANASGFAITCPNPVVELIGPVAGGNAWVFEHTTATAVLNWSFNSNGRMSLDQSGNLTIQGAYSPSDIALKYDVQDLGSVLARVMKLRPVEFRYKSGDGKRRVGLIAQEVQKLFPGLVKRDEGNGTLSLSQSEIPGILLKAFQELQAEVVRLRRPWLLRVCDGLFARWRNA